MVTADAITRFHMVFFEDHLAWRLDAGRTDGRCPACGFRDFTGSTEKVVTRSAGDVVSARENRSIAEANQFVCRGRGQGSTLARDVLDGR